LIYFLQTWYAIDLMVHAYLYTFSKNLKVGLSSEGSQIRGVG